MLSWALNTVRGLDFCYCGHCVSHGGATECTGVHTSSRTGWEEQEGSVVVMVGDNDPRNRTRLRLYSQLEVETNSNN